MTTGSPRIVVPSVPPERSYNSTCSRALLSGLGSYSPCRGMPASHPCAVIDSRPNHPKLPEFRTRQPWDPQSSRYRTGRASADRVTGAPVLGAEPEAGEGQSRAHLRHRHRHSRKEQDRPELLGNRSGPGSSPDLLRKRIHRAVAERAPPRHGGGTSGRDDVLRLRALLALSDVERHLLALLELAVSATGDV